MPSDLTRDALAIKDAGGPWPEYWDPFYEAFLRGEVESGFEMPIRQQHEFLYTCVEWLVKRGCVIEGASGYFVVADMGAFSLSEAIVAAVKAELGIKETTDEQA